MSPPFASRKQQAYVMMKLRKARFKQKPKEIGVGKKYFRARMEHPKTFKKGSFRIKDVGRKGGIKIIIGRPKGKKTTRTQSVLIPKGQFYTGKRFK